MKDRNFAFTVADIGLIHLMMPLNETLYKIAQLPTEDVIAKVNMTKCIAASWGKIVGPYQRDSKTGKVNFRSESVPKTLQQVAMSESQSCYSMDKGLTNKHFCAQVESQDGYRGPCDEDLGSPLLCESEGGKNVLMGLLTKADYCDETSMNYGQPAVFTHVRKYMNWITSVMKMVTY